MPKYIDSSNSSLAKENKTNNSKKKKKWTEDPVNTSPKTKMAKEHTKRWSTLLIIREMQNKTTVSYHLTSARRVSIKSLQTIHAGEGVEERGPFYIAGGNASWCGPR